MATVILLTLMAISWLYKQYRTKKTTSWAAVNVHMKNASNAINKAKSAQVTADAAAATASITGDPTDIAAAQNAQLVAESAAADAAVAAKTASDSHATMTAITTAQIEQTRANLQDNLNAAASAGDSVVVNQVQSQLNAVDATHATVLATSAAVAADPVFNQLASSNGNPSDVIAAATNQVALESGALPVDATTMSILAPPPSAASAVSNLLATSSAVLSSIVSSAPASSDEPAPPSMFSSVASIFGGSAASGSSTDLLPTDIGTSVPLVTSVPIIASPPVPEVALPPVALVSSVPIAASVPAASNTPTAPLPPVGPKTCKTGYVLENDTCWLNPQTGYSCSGDSCQSVLVGHTPTGMKLTSNGLLAHVNPFPKLKSTWYAKGDCDSKYKTVYFDPKVGNANDSYGATQCVKCPDGSFLAEDGRTCVNDLNKDGYSGPGRFVNISDKDKDNGISLNAAIPQYWIKAGSQKIPIGTSVPTFGTVSCPKGTTAVKHAGTNMTRCMTKKCPDGSVLLGGICVRACPPGSTMNKDANCALLPPYKRGSLD